MEWDNLSPEQRRHLEADHADFERQLVRTGVDLRAASPQLNEIEAPRRRDVAGVDGVETFLEEFTIDFSGILETLRRLPDGAGTSAFVAAYNLARRDWRDRSSIERTLRS